MVHAGRGNTRIIYRSGTRLMRGIAQDGPAKMKAVDAETARRQDGRSMAKAWQNGKRNSRLEASTSHFAGDLTRGFAEPYKKHKEECKKRKDVLMNTQKIRDVISEIQRVKSDLAYQVEAIKARDEYSDSWKKEEIRKAEAAALQILAEIGERAENVVGEFAAQVVSPGFDYTSEKFSKAISFIRACGEDIPEAGWRQIINDFSGMPEELGVLRRMFHDGKAFSAAIAADEAVKAAEFDKTFPIRLGDTLYYATHTTSEGDLSGISAELGRFESTAGTEGTE